MLFQERDIHTDRQTDRQRERKPNSKKTRTNLQIIIHGRWSISRKIKIKTYSRKTSNKKEIWRNNSN